MTAKVPAQGTQVIRGNANVTHATFYVGVADGKGGTEFGSESTAAVMGGFGREEPEVEVQIGGLSSHSAAYGRQRAAAYLKACDIADNMTAALATSSSILGAFVEVARFLGLAITVGPEGGEVEYAFAETTSERSES